MTSHAAPALDPCSNDWSPITTAAGWVPFTGGIAGFIFAGMTFLLSSTPSGLQAAARGFKLLLTAFFAFVTLAYMSAAISGERVCGRAHTAHAIIGGILATAVIAMCVALSWVLVSFGKYTQEALSFLRYLIYFALTLIVVMLAVSSTGYYRALTGELGTSGALMLAVSGAFLIAGAAIAETVRRKRASERWQGRCVSALAGGTLAYLALASISTGIVVSSSVKPWSDTPRWVIEVSAWGALVPPLLVLFAAVGAIATHTPTETEATALTPPGPPEAPPAQGTQPANPVEELGTQ